MARVHLYVHGRGRGHATRSAAVASALRAAEHRVRVFAGDDAAPFFEDDPESERVASVRPGQALGGVPVAARRVVDGIRASGSDRPDVVISDGDLPGAVSARLRGIPCVAIGHGLVFGYCERPSSVPEAPWRREAAKARRAAAGSTVQIAVNFVPMQALTESTVVARASVPAAVAASESVDLLCYFRDPHRCAPVLRRAVQLGRTPVVFSDRDPEIAGVRWLALDPVGFARAMAGAQRVLSSAGSQLISECLARGIPHYPLFDAADDEQRLNVAMLRAAGVGDGCSFDEAEDAASLTAFLSGPPLAARAIDDPRPTVADAAVRAVARVAATD